MTITNGTFDTNLNGWILSGNNTTIWESGKAHVRSNSPYGASSEQFAYFYQTFTLDKPVLIFDIQAVISGDGDYACGDCLSYPYYFPIAETCGYTIKDSVGNVIKHAYVYGTALQTVSVDLSNYVGQDIKISFQAGASRAISNQYYDLLVDNIMTVPGITFNAVCPDISQYCDAVLYIDENYAGRTPFHIYLDIGTHSYSLFKNGYNRFDGSVSITSTEITAEQTTGINIDSALVVGPGGIINGTFDTDISGWIVGGSATWDNGRVHITNGGKISQIFAVSDNVLQFDYETLGHVSQDSGFGYQLYIDDVKVIDKRFFVYGTENVYLGNYIGRTAKILFYEIYNWEGWIDNVSIRHTTGIYNGMFEAGLAGWSTTGTVSPNTCSYEGIGSPCSGHVASLEQGSTMSQTFIVDKCALKFDWWTWGNNNGYTISVGGSTVQSKALPTSSHGTETADLTNYIGSPATITFYSNYYYLDIDNVIGITNPYDISVISYPSGAEIYLDNVDTGIATTDNPIIIDGGSEGTHTITLKLTGYSEYSQDINIVRCQTTYIYAVFAGCITFITTPAGASICIDNTDTGFITPKTLCYNPGETHTYILTLKNYKSVSDTVILASDKGNLINPTLVYNTGSARFNITPDGSKIIIDGTDTGKVTPDVVDNLPIGYHSYEIRKDNYYSLTGSFRSIVDKEKLITESLQQITGIENGTFDTNIDGWSVTSSNLTQGYVEWVNGKAHLITNGIPITLSKDFVATENTLVFNYYPPISLNTSCSIGWSVIADPGTPGQTTIASYCGWGRSSEHWGDFEVNLSQYIGRNIRLNLNLTGTKVFYIGGPAEAYLDNVGNVPKPRRSITFDTYCIKYPTCTINPIVDECSADIYLDGNFIGTNPIQVDLISLGNHQYIEKNKSYISTDTNTEDTTGTVSFTQGTASHIYLDGLYIPGPLSPAEGCVYIESTPAGAEIFIDDIDTGFTTPNTVCGLSLTNHLYELKLLNHTVYRGSFMLWSGFGEYLSVIITGSIYFNSIPGGAEIFLDGNDLGIKTPRLVDNIIAGHHEFTLRLPFYSDYTGRIYVIGEPKED